jgi:membrane associated rhomboid family serine protease
MFPISDNLPTLRRPIVTWLVLAGMWATWLLIEQGGMNPVALIAAVCNYGLVPGELTGRAPLGLAVPVGEGLACVVDNDPINWLTPITSMFLHGSWPHIIGNSLFLWVFGNNVEDSMGHGRYALFYLLTGLAASAAHIFVTPGSPIPTVGASGAISGVLGAYLILYPRARVNMLFILFFIFVRPIPAFIVLLYWFAIQVITGLPELTSVRSEVSGGVAVWAHVGGFVAGVVLVKLFADPRLVAAHQAAHADSHGYLWRSRR